MIDEPFFPKPKKPKKVRETGKGGTEQSGRAGVARRGGRSLKWTSPGHAGVPDQIELYGVEPMVQKLKTYFGCAMPTIGDSQWRGVARDLLAAAIRFTEYKAEGKVPTAHQLREHERLRAAGFTVNVVDYITPKE